MPARTISLEDRAANERAQLLKLLPLLTGKVNAVLAKKGQWTEPDLNERNIQVCCTVLSSQACHLKPRACRKLSADGGVPVNSTEACIVRHVLRTRMGAGRECV